MGCGARECEKVCADSFEYGVRWAPGGYVHRSKMTLEEAREFVEYAYSIGVVKGALEVIRRPLVEWETYDPHES